LYLAIWLTAKKSRQESFREGYVPFAVVLGIISGLLILQRSTSPAFILASVALVMYYMSGAKLRYIGLTILAGVAALALLVAVTPYRMNRITSFLNPEADPQGAGYHIKQAKIAIGSGGLTGVGYGQSVFSKVEGRLPEPFGDSIFAIIAEEFGFIGSVLVLGLFTVLVLRIFILAKKSRDSFAQLLLIGFGSLIGLQAVVNIGAMSGILPLTGAPLPFISYGGTALAVFLTIGGITANISRYT
jgi:cell division protein FtsW